MSNLDSNIIVRVSREERDALKRIVADEGLTVSDVIRDGIRQIIAIHQ